jgi:hypothetical protein
MVGTCMVCRGANRTLYEAKVSGKVTVNIADALAAVGGG